MVNVGKYTSPMDAMGYEPLFAEMARSQESSWKKIHCYRDFLAILQRYPTGEMLESVVHQQ